MKTAFQTFHGWYLTLLDNGYSHVYMPVRNVKPPSETFSVGITVSPRIETKNHERESRLARDQTLEFLREAFRSRVQVLSIEVGRSIDSIL
jgi:hypothetical protein